MKHFGLIGYPLGHSFSEKYFSEKFAVENISADYRLFPMKEISELENLLCFNSFIGLNITIPYKEKILNYLDEIDTIAEEIGAVNVVKLLIRDGKQYLKGYNTDVIGFEKSITPFITPLQNFALILGTGGAAKAIDYALRKFGICTKFVSRTPRPQALLYDDLNSEIISKYKIIVNTTPLGMHPKIDTCPDIPYHFITSEHLLFDAVYNPIKTLFLKKGEQYGAKTINGMAMLIGQAEEAWRIWNNPNI